MRISRTDKSSFESKYDERGNEVSNLYYSDGKLKSESSITNKYNDKNQLVQTTEINNSYYNKTRTITIIRIYEYDKNGNIVSEKNEKGNLGISYKYNEKGQLVEENRERLITKYKYNNKGLVEEETGYFDGEPSGTLIYEYK